MNIIGMLRSKSLAKVPSQSWVALHPFDLFGSHTQWFDFGRALVYVIRNVDLFQEQGKEEATEACADNHHLGLSPCFG